VESSFDNFSQYLMNPEISFRISSRFFMGCSLIAESSPCNHIGLPSSFSHHNLISPPSFGS
jgi:hypothetical protein